TARRLVGTDLVQAVPLVGSAALGPALFGHVELGLTVALLAGALPGAWLGAHVSIRAADDVIRPVLAVLLVVSGLKMLDVSSTVVGAVALVLAGAAAILVARGRRRASAGDGLPPGGLVPEPACLD